MVRRDLVIVGGGPAGMAAAVEARRHGLDVLLVEERPALGEAGTRLRRAAEASGATVRCDTLAWGVWGTRVAICREREGRAEVVDATRIVLATGAYERSVAFPGWTLPGVVTAGELASVRLAGRRIVMAGGGPLRVGFAARLHRLGARLVMVVEAAPRPGFSAVVRLLRRGLRDRAYLARHRVPLLPAHRVVRAEGERGVARVVAARVDRDWRPIPGTERTVEAEVLCLDQGLVPSTELAQLAGCRLHLDEDRGGHVPVRDEWLRTSVPGVLAAGDAGGVGRPQVALAEGRLAALGAAMDLGRVDAARAERLARPIRKRLARLRPRYAVGAGLYDLATSDTIVCRCEGVTAREVLDALRPGSLDPNAVKAETRAGMGACQGRSCARQVAALVARHVGCALDGVPLFTPRPPVKPVPMGVLALSEGPLD